MRNTRVKTKSPPRSIKPWEQLREQNKLVNDIEDTEREITELEQKLHRQ